MKKFLSLLLLAVCGLMASAAGPAVEFPELVHDFGTIAENGGAVSHEFSFTNTGDAPLMIVNASGIVRVHPARLPEKTDKSRQIRPYQGNIPPRRATRRIQQDCDHQNQCQDNQKGYTAHKRFRDTGKIIPLRE